MRKLKPKLFLAIAVSAMTLYARPVHMIELEFRQSSFTLSIAQHIKDSMNAFSIVLPTTEEFYNSVKVGQELGGKFKGASFLVNGHIGSRTITVKRKFIQEVGK